jgi:hypothetical protein
MEKKNIILELPCELIDKIDRLNTTDDRSAFISDLIEKQLQENERIRFKAGIESPSMMSNDESSFGISGVINLVDNQGVSLGKFNINTLDGFEELTKKIQEISEDPAVQIRASTLF